MRLDKFLKLTRLIKRRTQANALCDQGGVSLNGKVAKAAATVKPGDALEIRFGNRTVRADVLALPTRATANLAEAAQYVGIRGGDESHLDALANVPDGEA